MEKIKFICEEHDPKTIHIYSGPTNYYETLCGISVSEFDYEELKFLDRGKVNCERCIDKANKIKDWVKTLNKKRWLPVRKDDK